jgi:glycosyltransferase involved in cell wall biosynthesis
MDKLSIVITVYNEEDNIKPLVKAVDEALVGFEYDIIYVDDGSKDKTVKVIKSLEHPRVHLIELKKNYGQSYALAAGIDYADGDYIITMDGDLQNDPTDIPMMLQESKDGDFDLVTGIRQKRKDNFVRTIPSRIANFIVRKSTEVYIKDNGCALKLFKADAAKAVGLYGEMHRFIAILAHFEGATIKQVPVKHHARIHGVSKYGLSRTFKVISDLMLMIFFKKHMQKPMHLFGTTGAITLFAGLIINLVLLVEKFAFGEDIGGRPLLMLGVLLVIAGFQLITTGIILEFLMRTYFESQDKKPYRIRKITIGGQEKA